MGGWQQYASGNLNSPAAVNPPAVTDPSPAAQPITSPVAPGSTADLENLAAQGPQQLGQQLQQQQPQPQQPQPQQPQGGFSPNNPYAPIAAQYKQQWDSMQPPPENGGGVKRLLSNFFQGMGNSMMVSGGLTPPNVRRDQIGQHMMTMMQAANQWEEMQNMSRYRDALTQKMTQDADFERQMQPLRLQAEQQAVTAGQNALPTVRPVFSGADLASLGVPSNLASQFENKPLSEADMGSLRQMALAGKKQLFDYGQDGTGPNHGIWLMDSNYTPLRQVATISETGRSTAIAKLQAQQQANLIKQANASVYAYDPNQKATVLTTAGAAQQGGMQAIRAVKEADIRKDISDSRVLNDVAVKSNNLLDSSAALDQNQNQRDMITWAMSQADRDNQFRAGAFGTSIPTGWLNTLMNSANMQGASQLTKDYVVNTLSLREAAMGMQRVLTGSARANEAQINALQATVPGLETNSALARQKLAAFTQNIDMLRQGIPRIPGVDVVPLKTWSGPQTSVTQSTQQAPQPGFSFSQLPTSLQNNYHRVLRGIGIE